MHACTVLGSDPRSHRQYLPPRAQVGRQSSQLSANSVERRSFFNSCDLMLDFALERSGNHLVSRGAMDAARRLAGATRRALAGGAAIALLQAKIIHMTYAKKEPRAAQSSEASDIPTPAKSPAKSAGVVTLLQREQGTTLAELVEATGWLPHTTRAFADRPAQEGCQRRSDSRPRERSKSRPVMVWG
jgi:hypothetical protein